MSTLPHPRLFTLSLIALSFLGALDHTIVSTSLPLIAGDLGAVAHMSWIVVGYTLASTVFMPVFGRACDVVGAKPVLLAATAIFLLGSLLCGFATSIEQITAARVLQGIGASGMQLVPQTIIGIAVEPRRRAALMSKVGATFPVAIVVGPVLGGLIADTIGWPWVFWLNLPVGALALALAWVAIPADTPRGSRGFDPGGMIAVGALTIALVLGATWGAGEPGWAAPRTLGALAVAALAAVALVIIERRVAAPILPVALMRHRTVALATVLGVSTGLGLFAVVQYIPTYIQMSFGVSASASGIVPMSMIYGMLVGTLVSGSVVSRTGRYRWASVVGTVCGAAGLGAMVLVPTSAGLWAPAAVMAVVGLGVGLFMQLTVVIAQAGAPSGEVGSVTAVVTLTRQVVSTVGSALIGSWIGAHVIGGLGGTIAADDLVPERVRELPAAAQDLVAGLYEGAMTPVFVCMALVFVAAFAASLALPGDAMAEESSPPGSPAARTPERVHQR